MKILRKRQILRAAQDDKFEQYGLGWLQGLCWVGFVLGMGLGWFGGDR